MFQYHQQARADRERSLPRREVTEAEFLRAATAAGMRDPTMHVRIAQGLGSWVKVGEELLKLKADA